MKSAWNIIVVPKNVISITFAVYVELKVVRVMSMNVDVHLSNKNKRKFTKKLYIKDIMIEDKLHKISLCVSDVLVKS